MSLQVGKGLVSAFTPLAYNPDCGREMLDRKVDNYVALWDSYPPE